MKILIPAWSFYPSQEGGPSNALYWLATGLVTAGYEVKVVASNRCIKEGEVIENTWTRLNGFDVIYASIADYFTILKKEVENCDLLIANGLCLFNNFRINRYALQLDKKVILSPRGELLDSAIYHKGKAYGFLKGFVFSIMKIVYGRKVLYHATSYEEVESIKKYMGRCARISLIPNYMILPKKIALESATEKYLLYVGRLNHIKNIDVILSGLANSNAFMDSPYKMKLAGERSGEYYEMLVKLSEELGISQKVEFLGLVTGEEKNLLYAQAKCLLLISKSENFGNVIVEALSQGTPVIASKGTPWPLLEKRGAGFWIDAEPEQVSEAVDKILLLERDAYVRLRENAYTFSKEFDIYTNIGKWVEVIENL